MKKSAAVFMILFCVMIVCGCQPTPEEAFIVGKNEQPSLPAEAAPSVSAVPSAKTRERWQETFSSRTGAFEIVVDAEIDDQNLKAGNEYEVTQRKFSQDELEQVIRTLVGDNKIYDVDVFPDYWSTKEALQEDLLFHKSITSKLETENDKEFNQQNIQVTEEELTYAPSADEVRKNELPIEKLNASYKFAVVENGTDRFDTILVVNQLSDDNQTCINYIGRKNRTKDSLYSNEHAQTEPAIGMELSREDAISLAEKSLQDMGMGDYVLASCNVSDRIYNYYTLDKDGPEDQCYTMRFTRMVNGTPMNDVINSNGLTDSEDGLVRKVISSETVIVHVSDDGITGFYWGRPLKIEKISEGNSDLLDFEIVKQKCKDFLMAANTDIIDGIVTEVHIDKIQLGWMMVPKKDSQDTLRLVPVWDFYGYNMVENNGKEEKEERIGYSQLTINALDGSVINRIRGY